MVFVLNVLLAALAYLAVVDIAPSLHVERAPAVFLGILLAIVVFLANFAVHVI